MKKRRKRRVRRRPAGIPYELGKVHCADCVEAMRALPEASVDAVVTDPPYYKVKSEAWDRQWDKPEAFLEWFAVLTAEWRRVLAGNGSLYVFASPQMAARVECVVREHMRVLNHLVWPKEDEPTKALMYGPDRFRQYVPKSERLIFAEQYGADSMAKGEASYAAKGDELRGFVFEPLRAYLDGERKRAGVERAAIEAETKTQMYGHWFSRVQWALPTAKHYATLRALFNRGGGEYLRREYEDLRREYEDLRRPFNVTPEVSYTDVWSFRTVQARKGKHPCEKPLDMMEHIVRASTRPDALVLDCFAGSGVTGEAAVRLGRRFLGFELSRAWCDRANMRVTNAVGAARAAAGIPAVPEQTGRPHHVSGQRSLFEEAS